MQLVSVPRALAVLKLVGLGLGVGLTGCGDDGPPAGTGPGPLTSRAVAAVMLDHLPDDTRSRSATYVDEYSPPGLVGADLRYAAGEGDDGDLVRLTVSREQGPKPCAADEARCADLGDGAVLRWDELVEEEDPGYVAVQARYDGQLVSALVSGPAISADPRELDLEPSVETLVELVGDPRLRLSASAGTLAAGRALADWDGGEVDPASLEKVANDDVTVVTGWIWGYGDAWRYVGPSPLTSKLGEGAIGGRIEVTGDLGPLAKGGIVDALAAPQPPAWLDGDCLEGYRCETRQGLTLVWRPAAGDDPGDAFVLRVGQDGETVGFHTVGNRLGERWGEAFPQAGGPFWGSDLDHEEADPLAISMTTTRARYEQAIRAARLHR